MLYHHLLSRLISTSPPFDFLAFWYRLELDPFNQFSTCFLLQTGLISDCGHSPTITCLDDLAQIWKNTIQELDVTGVGTLLQLIHRLQPYSKWRPKGGIWATDTLIDVTAAQHDNNLIRTAEASANDVYTNTTCDEEFAKAIAESLTEAKVRDQDVDVKINSWEYAASSSN
jgi:hypothetical protein